MNERIKELAIEALDYADKNHSADQHWFKVYNKKFAELIVRECAELIDSKRELGLDPGGDYVKGHFGVDE